MEQRGQVGSRVWLRWIDGDRRWINGDRSDIDALQTQATRDRSNIERGAFFRRLSDCRRSDGDRSDLTRSKESAALLIEEDLLTERPHR